MMKNLKAISILFLMLFLTGTLMAGAKKTVDTKVEKNLMEGLRSDNLGLKTNSAYLLGEYGTERSIIALMKVLRDGKTEEERISAALALTKINTEKAMFAVKQRARFDESERVRKCCQKFYQQNLLNREEL